MNDNLISRMEAELRRLESEYWNRMNDEHQYFESGFDAAIEFVRKVQNEAAAQPEA